MVDELVGVGHQEWAVVVRRDSLQCIVGIAIQRLLTCKAATVDGVILHDGMELLPRNGVLYQVTTMVLPLD